MECVTSFDKSKIYYDLLNSKRKKNAVLHSLGMNHTQHKTAANFFAKKAIK